MVRKFNYIALYVTQVHRLKVVQATNSLSYEHDSGESEQVEEVYFIGNQGLGSLFPFQRSIENHGRNFEVGLSCGRGESKMVQFYYEREEECELP